MSRDIRLDRAEAEFIVDACEKTGIPQWMELAAQLREAFGMSPYPAGTVNELYLQGGNHR